ncbi:MAG: hypothetical protein GC151_15745 [Betaproteobacteria bacterium]|nr:hypothetical protein [Betaproteobacteria bacterium]
MGARKGGQGRGGLIGVVVAVLLGIWGLGAVAPGAWADEEEQIHDIGLPLGDAAAIELGKTRFGEKCGGFCHGSGGKGGRGPCLICGRYKHGNKDSDLVRNITNGVTGTPMGAFGSMYSKEEIAAIVVYLRSQQKKKEAGEL